MRWLEWMDGSRRDETGKAERKGAEPVSVRIGPSPSNLALMGPVLIHLGLPYAGHSVASLLPTLGFASSFFRAEKTGRGRP